MVDESRELVGRAAGGDGQAVDDLLTRHLPGLRAFIRLRAGAELRQKESVSDLAQSVCREVLEHLDRYQYRGEAEFRNWLYTTAQRKLAHRRRYHVAARRDVARERRVDPDASDASVALAYRSICSPSRAAIAREELERVEGAFDRLPEDYRHAIVLARIVGLSGAELAAELQRSEVAARKLLSRALAALALALES